LIFGSGGFSSILHNVLTDSAAHPECCPLDTGGAFPCDIKPGQSFFFGGGEGVQINEPLFWAGL
jgi:hypothetical protein